MNATSVFMRAAAAAALLLAGSLGALAVEATADVELNVRTGPGTGFGVIDTLEAGELVNTTECQASGWCYIEHDGPNGWVSSNYLSAVEPDDPAAGSDCELKLTITASGPKLEVVCAGVPGTGSGTGTGTGTGSGSGTGPATPPPVGDEACFYLNANYQGSDFCYAVGTLNSLNADFDDRISSVRLHGAAKARLCANNNLGGYCKTISSDTPVLGVLINNRTSSLEVFTEGDAGIVIPLPLPLNTLPSTFKTGFISIASSYTADLDTGKVAGAGADIWHHAINAAVRRLEPRNGAQIALGDGSNRGYAGCSTAAFSSDPVPFSLLMVGTYVCVKTDEGRISQFRVNGYDGTTMKIGFTTWAKN